MLEDKVFVSPNWLYGQVVAPALAPPTKDFAERSLHYPPEKDNAQGIVSTGRAAGFFEGHGVDADLAMAVLSALELCAKLPACVDGGVPQLVFPGVLSETPEAWLSATESHKHVGRRVKLAECGRMFPPGMMGKVQVALLQHTEDKAPQLWRSGCIVRMGSARLYINLSQQKRTVEVCVKYFGSDAVADANAALTLALRCIEQQCSGLRTLVYVLSIRELESGLEPAQVSHYSIEEVERRLCEGNKPLAAQKCELYDVPSELLLRLPFPSEIRPALAVGVGDPGDECFDVFASHDWGQGHANHKRVVEFCQLLRERGLRVWLDEEQISGDIVDRMCSGIERSTVVLIFVTQSYMDKLRDEKETDNCLREFRYATLCRTVANMLAVVMEEAMSNTAEWRRHLGMDLGHKLYVANWEQGHHQATAADEVVAEVKKRPSVFSRRSVCRA